MLDVMVTDMVSTYLATKTQAFGGRMAWALSGDNSRPILSSRGRKAIGETATIRFASFAS